MIRFLHYSLGFLAWICTVAPALEWFWKAFVKSENPPPTLWALTVSLSFAILWITVTYCTYRQGILRDEITRCAEAKSALEREVLSKRQTSVKKGKK